MITIPATILTETDITTVIAEVERQFAPDVVRIRYEVGQDWKDDWSLFFRVVLANHVAAGGGKRIREVAQPVEDAIESRLSFSPSTGLLLSGHGVIKTIYCNYRSVAEQAVLREEAWA